MTIAEANAVVDKEGIGALDRCLTPEDFIPVANVLKKRGLMIVHLLGYGHTACMRQGPRTGPKTIGGPATGKT